MLNPDLFWPAIWSPRPGNFLGGMISWWMGLGAHKAWIILYEHRRADTLRPTPNHPELTRTERRVRIWLRKFGAGLPLELAAHRG